MSRNERKTSKGKPQTQDTTPDNRKTQQKSSKPQTEDDLLRQKIDTVKAVTSWPDEDIVRVLEKCNMDPDVAMNNILDGLEKVPNSWEEVKSKRTKAENKVKNPQSLPEQSPLNKGTKLHKKPGDVVRDKDKQNDQRKRQNPKNPVLKDGLKENGRAHELNNRQQTVSKEVVTNSVKDHSNSLTGISIPETSSIQIPTPQLQREREEGERVSEQRYSQTKQEIHQIQPDQSPKRQESVREEKEQSSPQVIQNDVQSSLTSGIANTYAYSTARQYHPPGMKTWKPKDTQKSSVNETLETLVSTNNIPSRGSSSSNIFSAGPVVLPSALATALDSQDVQFGNFYEQTENTSSSSSVKTSSPLSEQSSNLVEVKIASSVTSSEFSVSSTEQEIGAPSREEVHQIPNQPNFGYLPINRTSHFIPNYGAHFPSYENSDVAHFTGYEADVPNARQPASFDGQQNFQNQSGYQREPSPTDATKYLSRGEIVQNSSFRDNKFSADVVNQSQVPPNAQGAHTTQGSYGYSTPIYAYAPYIPNQYGSYQNPQHSQYPYPRYFRGPYPNYSGTTPAYPTPNAASNTVYTEEMVQAAEYKNMFPTMPSPFFHTDANTNNLMGKTPSPQGQQNVSPPSKGQSQSFSPPPTSTVQSGTSPELSYKTQQVAYQQNPSIQPRETSSGPSSYYNMMQYGQQTSTTFPYVHIQPQQYPRGQQQQQQQQYMQN